MICYFIWGIYVRTNSKVKITVDNFEVEKYNFLCKIKGIVVMEEIPSSIIVNWNHTLKSVNKSAKEIPVN